MRGHSITYSANMMLNGNPHQNYTAWNSHAFSGLILFHDTYPDIKWYGFNIQKSS